MWCSKVIDGGQEWRWQMEAMADNRCAPTEEGGERFVVKGRLLVVIKDSSSW